MVLFVDDEYRVRASWITIRSRERGHHAMYLGQREARREPRQQTVDSRPLLDRQIEDGVVREDDDLDLDRTRALGGGRARRDMGRSTHLTARSDGRDIGRAIE